MAYQIKKVGRIVEELELLAPDDSTAMLIHVSVSPETIASKFRSVQLDIANAKRVGDMEAFGDAVISLFDLVFGTETTQKILDYFDGAYVDMAIQVLPFIYDRIQPAVQHYVSSRKAMIANNASLNRKQCRKLGL